MMDKQCSLLLYALLAVVVSIDASKQVKLNTRLGMVVGTNSTITSKPAHRFLGIPYAKAPVGKRRFSKPEPCGEFGGILEALDFGPVCPQSVGNELIGDEDCLYLNIFTPGAPSKSPKTTMIWIHGGAFMFGSSNDFPADILACEEDVVVVTMNYRLTVLGFLTTGDSRVPGNYGLWDQRLAIQWVKENIADYGGNPDSITLFGESAGARAASFQMFSPTNTPELFQRVIAQSGSALSLTYLNRYPLAKFSTVCEHVNCSLDDPSFLDCLRSKPLNELMKAADLVKSPYPFYPVVDGDFLHHDLGHLLANFTSAHDKDSIAKVSEHFGHYDLLGGWNNQEGLYYLAILEKISRQIASESPLNGISVDVLKSALKEFPFHNYPEDNHNRNVIIDMFINFYENNLQDLVGHQRSPEEQRLEIYSQISGDIGLKLPVAQLVQLHSAVSTQKTFAYEFQRKRSRNIQPATMPDWLRVGANHADELTYVFGYPMMPEDSATALQSFLRCFDCTDEDKKVSKQMMNRWANFARTGHPGDDFEEFHYPSNTLYTVINSSSFELLPYTSTEKTLLWSSVEAALIYSGSRATEDVGADISHSTSYLFGHLTLTDRESDVLITYLLALTSTLLLLLLVLICKPTKASFGRQKKHL